MKCQPPIQGVKHYPYPKHAMEIVTEAPWDLDHAWQIWQEWRRKKRCSIWSRMLVEGRLQKRREEDWTIDGCSNQEVNATKGNTALHVETNSLESPLWCVERDNACDVETTNFGVWRGIMPVNRNVSS